ncbi:MAG: hypothetical protein A2167_06885 [Planctomycetes bacterium RBG_13_46_10]|nr:MAG: hypothetical protein A2167_06885 [Planctomycetes bacterium RBG_13_46_10]
MNLLALMTEDITELLVKIIEFANARQKILIRNITDCYGIDYVPRDLEVNKFCRLLNDAIDEHIKYRRLILYDTENIKFQIKGSLQVKSVVDKYAQKLLEDDRNEYLRVQINKLIENSLNQRIAAELLGRKQKVSAINYRTIDCSDDAESKKDLGNN